MNIIKQTSQKCANPKTLVITDCMKTVFDTGHTMTQWADGTVFYTNKSGNAMNEKSGTKLISQMNKLGRLK